MANPTYPSDCIQSLLQDDRWVEDTERVDRGRLIWAHVPHAEASPYILVPAGRPNPTEHGRANYEVRTIEDGGLVNTGVLPVAAFPTWEGAVYEVRSTKRRPALILRTTNPEVDSQHRRGASKWSTAPTLLIAPFYTATPGPTRMGFPAQFVERIKMCEYPQFLWDILPGAAKGDESILMMNRIQPISGNPTVFSLTRHRLSEKALAVVDEWLDWLLFDDLQGDFLSPARSILMGEEAR